MNDIVGKPYPNPGHLNDNLKVSKFIQRVAAGHKTTRKYPLGKTTLGQYFHDNFSDILSDMEELEFSERFVLPYIADQFNELEQRN